MDCVPMDIVLKSVLNFRDIGGIPGYMNKIIRRGLIFRSAHPDRISKKDAEKLICLKIKTIIDLRAPYENYKKPRPIDNASKLSLPLDFQYVTREKLRPVVYKSNAISEIAEISISLYLEILDAAAPAVREILDILCSPERCPVPIHCHAGKDRTGIVIALILMTLGAGRQLIVDDFMRSNDELLPSFKRYFIIRKILLLGFFPYRNMLFAVTVRQRNLESVLDRVENCYGGIEGYLNYAGFDPSRLADLRNKLLEG